MQCNRGFENNVIGNDILLNNFFVFTARIELRVKTVLYDVTGKFAIFKS